MVITDLRRKRKTLWRAMIHLVVPHQTIHAIRVRASPEIQFLLGQFGEIPGHCLSSRMKNGAIPRLMPAHIFKRQVT